MRSENTGSKSYLAKTPGNFPQEAARANKKMYLEACLQQRQHFLPFVASIDEILDVEAAATLKIMSSRLSTKWQQL